MGLQLAVAAVTVLGIGQVVRTYDPATALLLLVGAAIVAVVGALAAAAVPAQRKQYSSGLPSVRTWNPSDR